MVFNQIAQRFPERECGSPTYTTEQAALEAAQADHVVAAVRARPENGIAPAQLVECLAQDSRA